MTFTAPRSPHSLERLIIATLAATACCTASYAATSGLEEVVVTAQKRVENLQDTPVAVAVVGGEQIEKLNLDDIGAIAASQPSLVYNEVGGEAQLYIRGIGSNLFSVGVDQSVATHIDGIYAARSNMGLIQFLDVDRVELLRGPQGTLYGRNATGGVINVLSRRPTATPEGYFSALRGSFNRSDLRGALSGPLSEEFSGRVAVRKLKDDGYTKDIDPRGTNKIDDNDLEAARATVRWQRDGARVDLITDYSSFHNGNTSIFPIDSAGLAQSFGAVATGDIHLTRNNTPSFHRWHTGGVTLDASVPIGETTRVDALVGYRNWDSDFLFNTDGTEIEISRTTFAYQSKQLSAELRLSGESALGDWLVGAYRLDEDKFGGLGLVRAGFTPPVSQAPRSFVFRADGKGVASAAFGQLQHSLTDRWLVSAGLRYSRETKRDLLRNSTLLPDNELLGLYTPNTIPAATAASTRDAARTWSAWTPRLGLEFRPNAEALLYATYSAGFKSGGFNDLSVINPPFDPEKIRSVEIGAKTEWFDHRLRLNGNVFWYDYTDLQVSVYANVGSVTTTFTTNAAAATVKGAEIELSARPLPQLDISLAVNLLDARYDRFLVPYGTCTAANAALDARCIGRAGLPRLIDAAGKRLNNAPTVKGTLAAAYNIALNGGGVVTLGGVLSHQGRIYFLPANPLGVSQAGYTLADARIGYTNAAGNVEVNAFGKNLGNTAYFHTLVQYTSTSDGRNDPFNVGNALGYPAPGRQWGVELTYRFGK